MRNRRIPARQNRNTEMSMEEQDFSLPPANPAKPLPVRAGMRWPLRFAAGIVLALAAGSMPVYIHQEIAELSRLKAELQDTRVLAESMYGRMEDSAARLRGIKTVRGAARVMREKGFVPPGARVYQMEPEETGEKTHEETGVKP